MPAQNPLYSNNFYVDPNSSPAVTGSVFDLITSREVATYFNTIQSNKIPYLGEGLFPMKRKQGLTLETIEGYDSLPVILSPASFDAKPPLREQGGLSISSMTMPFFRESIRMGETDRQELADFYASNPNSQRTIALLNKNFDGIASLLESAFLNNEIMRMGIITEGKFVIESSQGSNLYRYYAYEYDKSGEWNKQNVINLTKGWDKDDSNPLLDIINIKRQALQRTGTRLTRAILSQEAWLDLYNNKAIRFSIQNPTSVQGGAFLTEQTIKTFFEQATGLRIEVYDKVYKTLKGDTQFLYPQGGRMTLLPDGSLGTTWQSTTPEEFDLQRNSNVDVSVIRGVTLASKVESLPVNRIFWVSSIALPSCEQLKNIYNIRYNRETIA